MKDMGQAYLKHQAQGHFNSRFRALIAAKAFVNVNVYFIYSTVHCLSLAAYS